MLFIRPQPHRAENDSGGRTARSQSLQNPAPAEIVRQIPGGDAMEAAEPFFEPFVVGIDVVEVVVRRQRIWLSRPRQNMRDDLGPPRKGDDGAAAIAAERIGSGNDAIQSRGD